jgi:hypothetical protein
MKRAANDRRIAADRHAAKQIKRVVIVCKPPRRLNPTGGASLEDKRGTRIEAKPSAPNAPITMVLPLTAAANASSPPFAVSSPHDLCGRNAWLTASNAPRNQHCQ